MKTNFLIAMVAIGVGFATNGIAQEQKAEEARAAKAQAEKQGVSEQAEIEEVDEGQTIQLPVLATTRVSTTVSVPDAGPVLHGRSRRLSSRQRLANAKLQQSLTNQICIKQISEGKSYFDILHEQRPVEIWITGTDDKQKIRIKATRKFDRDNLDELADLHPDLYLHISNIPARSNGKPISLSFEMDVEYEFEGIEDLKKRDPEMFKIFEKYVAPSTARSPVMSIVVPRIIITEEEELEQTRVGPSEKSKK